MKGNNNVLDVYIDYRLYILCSTQKRTPHSGAIASSDIA